MIAHALQYIYNDSNFMLNYFLSNYNIAINSIVPLPTMDRVYVSIQCLIGYKNHKCMDGGHAR